MKKARLFFGIFLLGVGCTGEKEEVYDFVEVCQNKYYESYGINATDTLLSFEQDLIQAGLLANSSYAAYQDLLDELSKEIYFDKYPIRISAQAPLLTLNPQNLQACVFNSFDVDSLTLAQTAYYQLQVDLQNYYSSSENIHISGVFDRYLKHLDAQEFEHPFIRLELLKLIYRWYFESELQQKTPY
ncbi:hypothetical protein SAMN05216474_1315 [Lishizhenia tianjinensis]|uniref:Uncharacterized protein n=1 Tax=Lishizhenia tianjinensis TaxID=477690 RepID=A0A1I6YZP5_9FLAO|nr:hypothetical protein [Lishizhenia tianjinensis]SFT55858.1 hypothetical protein SAMN05216474_1315 [Lishizhenia tianjinensis]